VSDFPFDVLRRHPDIEADNLFAFDASDRLLLDEAADALGAAAAAHPGLADPSLADPGPAHPGLAHPAAASPGSIVVIGDGYGALTLGAAERFGASGIRVHQDALSGELALAENAARAGLTDAFANLPLGEKLLTGATVVLLQLPRSLAALDDIARAIAAFADPSVVVYAGGRVKHMTLAMNEVLGRSFAEVSATLARQKSRVLVAREPRPSMTAAPVRREWHADAGLWVCATGGAFAGATIDIGTRLLLAHLFEAAPDARTAIDLGCGTGVLAAAVALARPGIRVVASDQSAAAVASARETMAANGVAERVDVLRADALHGLPDASADLVLLNPPFHVGSTVEPAIALRLFEAAARVLAPGGELWTVYNSPLGHRAALERIVGPTRQIDRNAKFTLTASTRG
jgi:16S rRNA (guanine1207-N2)-methyltransferase